MSESKIKGFAKGIAKATGRVAGATLRGTGTAIGGIAKGIGIVLGELANEAEKLADKPKGTAKKLHNAAQSVIKNMKESKLAANAGKLKTAFHAGKLALSGVVTVMTESIALLDNVLFDNGILNTLEKKFAEFKGDTSKFKKWLKEHDRLGAYTIYYGTICMVFAFLWEAGLADQFGKGDETLTKKSQKIIKDLKKEVEDSEIGKKIIGPWMEDKKEETKPTVQKEPDPNQNSGKKVEKQPTRTPAKVSSPSLVDTNELFFVQNRDIYIDLDYIRNLCKGKTLTEQTKIKIEALDKIHQHSAYMKRFRPSLIKSEGFEPSFYLLGDGHISQGAAMTWDYPVLPGQEPEYWMYVKKDAQANQNRVYRTKTLYRFTPLFGFVASIRSYNDYWQQVNMFMSDPKQNIYLVFDYLLTQTKVSSVHMDGMVAIDVTAYQDMAYAKQTINRLVDKKDKTKFTTDENQINDAFSTKKSQTYKQNRRAKDRDTYMGKEITLDLTVGQHSSKSIVYANPQAFLDANGSNGKDFNIQFDRYINTAQRSAFFKLVYRVVYPDDKHFVMTDDELQLVTKLNKDYGEKWAKDLDNAIQSSKGIKQALYRAQRAAIIYMLAHPEEVYNNPLKIKNMLQNWPKKKDYSKDTSQFENVDHSTMLAMTNNMRGLGM